MVASLCKLDKCKLHTLSIVFSLGDLLDKEDGTFIPGHPFFFPALKSIREITLYRGQLSWITKWMLSLANLEILTVWGQPIGQQEFEMVGTIPSLLEFTTVSCLEPVIIGSSTSTGGFQQLQMFKLSFCVGEFMFEPGAMPNVRKLSLNIMLEKIRSASDGRGCFDDIGIQHLSSLASLHIDINWTAVAECRHRCRGCGACFKEHGRSTPQQSFVRNEESLGRAPALDGDVESHSWLVPRLFQI